MVALFLLFLLPLQALSQPDKIVFANDDESGALTDEQLALPPTLFECDRFDRTRSVTLVQELDKDDPKHEDFDQRYCCAGSQANGRDCIDMGLGFGSNIGNFTIKLIHITDLENKDGFGAAGGVSDPFVMVDIKGSTATAKLNATAVSSVVRNNLQPQFGGEEINLGFQKSGTDAVMRVFDKDSGLEFEDDLLSMVEFRVPYW